MKRFIMTGAPGSGKTSILRLLADRGYAVVAEAATDVIAAAQARGTGEPWQDPLFIDTVVRLQNHRLQDPVSPGAVAQVHDRSPVCTLALARYLGHPVSAELSDSIASITEGHIFDRRVLFARTIGFCEPTPARQISYQDSLAFERVHAAEYLRLGFELVDIPAAPVQQRADLAGALIRSWA